MPKNVLITEDDLLTAKLLQESLKSLNYNVVAIAQNAEEAIELAGIHNPNLVIMDINLPGDIDGIEATKRIRTTYKIPVVYLTSHSDTSTLERALNTEPNGYVLKPFKKQELFTVIEMALHRDTLEKKLKANEQFLALTLECIGDGLITTDTEGKITLINREAEKLTGFSIKEIKGKNILQVYPIALEETNEKFKSFDDLLNSYFGLEQNEDIILTLKDNSIIPISQTIAPIKDENSNIKGFIITFRDISLMKKAQTALRRINEELEERVSQRTVELRSKNIELESEIQKRRIVENNLYKALEKEKELNELKSRVLTTISHEFKTPITSILSSIELLNKYTINQPVSEKIIKHYDIIRNASMVLTQMVNDVLLIEKIDADKYEFNFQEGNIGEFIREIINEFQSSSGKNHHFVFETINLPEKTLIEKTLLRRILNNLISNSIKYSKEKTMITVSLDYLNKKFTLIVSDKGIGIPDEDQKYLFNLFHRAKNVLNYEGTGLGLSIIFKSVTLLNGTIRLKSKIEKGTSFIIAFPEFSFDSSGKFK